MVTVEIGLHFLNYDEFVDQESTSIAEVSQRVSKSMQLQLNELVASIRTYNESHSEES